MLIWIYGQLFVLITTKRGYPSQKMNSRPLFNRVIERPFVVHDNVSKTFFNFDGGGQFVQRRAVTSVAPSEIAEY